VAGFASRGAADRRVTAARAGFLMGTLVVVVSAAAGRAPLLAHAHGTEAIAGRSGLAALVIAGVVAFGAAAALVVTHQRRRGLDDVPPREAGPRAPWRENVPVAAAAIALIVAAAGGGLATARLLERDHGSAERAGAPAPAASALPRGATAEPGHGAGHLAPWVIVALLAASGFSFALTLRRLASPLPSDDDAVEPQSAAAAAGAALDAGDDPRSAILAAYAAMELRLAEAGYRRRPSEAPREYLARAFVRTRAGAAPARRLTALFERARFGDVAMTERDRRDASAALGELRERVP
jgi:hypothetical protein